MTEQLVYRDCDSGSAAPVLPALCALYSEVYAEPPYLEGPAQVREFRSRFADHRAEPDFALTSCWAGENLVGYLYGFGVPPGADLWDTLLVRGDPRARNVPSRPTAYVAELLVRSDVRRRGVARALHERFVAARPESQLALLAHPDAAAAQAFYRSLGWRRIGYGYPFPNGDEYQTLMLFRRQEG